MGHKHVVMFSGGICSWAAAKRVAEKEGPENVVLLFSDTNMEDEDLYRFLEEGAENVGSELIRIADGRNPWEVMQDNNYIANTRADMCSRILKRELLDKWRNANCSQEDSTIYLGLSWDEQHRVDRINDRCAPWRYEAPMAEKPYLTKTQMIEWLVSEGIAPPRLYAMGFPHNNCGGFCIKAGQAHFAHLLRVMPERYAWHEEQEEALRKRIGDYSILRDRTGGKVRAMSLREFRENMEAQLEFDVHEWGGCGCAVDV